MKQPTSQMKGMSIRAIMYGEPVYGKELKLCTDEAIQEAYANARVTAMDSMGTGNQIKNFKLQEQWYLELQRRSLTPDGREGIKNGNGAI